MLSDLHASLINGRFLCGGEAAPRELIHPATEEHFPAVYDAHSGDIQIAAHGAPATAPGNPATLNPDTHSPLGALALGRLALEAGVPPGALQVICGRGSEIGDALALSPLVRKISFTGSTQVGRRVIELAANDF